MEKNLLRNPPDSSFYLGNSEYSELYAWFIWSLAALFYGYQFILRISIGVMTDCLMRDFAIEACSLGILSGCYYISYTLLQIPIGISLDKFGASFLIRGSIICCITGTIIFSVASSLYTASFGRILIGAGSACAFLGAVKLATSWFKPERLPLVVGFTILVGKIGAILGQTLLASLITFVGWRNSMYLTSIVGVFLAIGIWVFIKDAHPYATASYRRTRDNERNIDILLKGLKDIIYNKQIWALSIYGAMMYVPLAAFADLWGIPYLMKLYNNISREQAAFAVNMIFIGAGLGSPLVALISNYMEERKRIMLVGAILSCFINVIIMVLNISYFSMAILLFLVGFVFPCQSLIFSAVCQVTPYSNNCTAVSFTNMVVMISGVIMQPLLGWLLDKVWDGYMKDGFPIYSIENYQFALMSIPLCLLVAIFTMSFVPETFPKKTTS